MHSTLPAPRDGKEYSPGLRSTLSPFAKVFSPGKPPVQPFARPVSETSSLDYADGGALVTGSPSNRSSLLPRRFMNNAGKSLNTDRAASLCLEERERPFSDTSSPFRLPCQPRRDLLAEDEATQQALTQLGRLTVTSTGYQYGYGDDGSCHGAHHERPNSGKTRPRNKGRSKPWWTMELAVLRSEWRRVDSLYNANLATMDECKLIHNAYRSAVRRAKRDYWEREAVRIEALAAMRYTRLQKKADAVPICHDGVVAEAVADEAAALMTLSRPAPAASCLPPLSNTTTQLSAS